MSTGVPHISLSVETLGLSTVLARQPKTGNCQHLDFACDKVQDVAFPEACLQRTCSDPKHVKLRKTGGARARITSFTVGHKQKLLNSRLWLLPR